MNKMMLLCALSVFIVGCSSTPKTVSAPAKTTAVVAAAPAAATTTNVATAEKKDNEVVCKMQKVLGSNMKKRVCATKARIAENEADTKRAVNEMSMGRTEPLQGQ